MKNTDNQEMYKEMNVQELSVDDLQQVSAGCFGFWIPLVKDIGQKIVNLFK